MRADAAIVEVGLNEASMRHANPNVPYSPAECAADALRCAAAGAAVVHWHARDADTGAPRFGDASAYAEALELMQAGGDVLAYPTYPVDVPVGQRLEHVWELGKVAGLELAPVDIGSVTTVLWDDARHDFVGVDALGDGSVVDNPLSFTLDALRRADELGMVPTLGAFDVGFTRTMVLLTESGRLRPPVFLKIFLSGGWAVGPFPSEAALDFHLAQIPDDLDVEWVAVPYALDDASAVERLCRHALSRGGGIRVGIGDSPAAFPEATNADLVERAVGWCADAGRPVATPSDVRARLGISPR
ncbi:MAG TPA: 3-keto-5-aminohexanoate cleavage protein [Acidimicrobiia bacterium]|jgi:uncharacterized protein (DUF849 family)